MRFLLTDLPHGMAAIVSTHGYFEIQAADEFHGYRADFTDIIRDPDGNPVARPTVFYRGSTDEIGLPYDPDCDDLVFPADVGIEDEVDYVQARLVAYLEERS